VFAAFTTRAPRDEVGENLARGSAVEVAGVEVVRRVDDDPAVPVEALDGLSDARPRHGDDDDVRRGRLVDRAGRCSLTERRDQRGQRFRAAAIGHHDLAAGTQRGPRHRLAEPAGADDSHIHQVSSSNSDANR
jgi:hypothetical protein